MCSRNWARGDGDVERAFAERFLATLDEGQEVRHDLAPGRHAWLQVLKGGVTLNRQNAFAGDGAALSDEPGLAIRAGRPSEVLLFDLA